MINMIWVVLFVALTGSHLGYGLPVRPTPQTYPHDEHSLEGWTPEGGLYAAIPALALVFVALAFLFGCTWCYRHKDCKPNEGADNQLFTASASHIQTPQRLQPPDSGFSEPVNNNVGGEDNNNGPISLREMQNIANNNAGAYIFNENEERNANRRTQSRESIVLFDPLPVEIHVDDPLEPYSEWFTSEHFPRNNLQYLREVGRGWFGRVVASEIDNEGTSQTIAVKILNQNASLEDKARFLEETRMYRELSHAQILKFLGKCLEEEPWLLLFELCTVDLQRYLIVNRPRMAILNESGVPLQLMSDVSSALAYMHSHGFTYGYLWGGSVLVRGSSEDARAVLGRYEVVDPQHDCFAPEVLRRGAIYTPNSEIWSLGTLIWEVCSWGSIPTAGRPSPPPDLPCPYKSHLYQVMQLCWNQIPEERPTAAQVHALINHLHSTHALVRTHADNADSDMYASSDFEERWQRLKPNSIPKVDEHIAIVHAPSTSTAHFSESEHGFENTLSADMDTAVSRSSSIMSDKDPLESQIKSESLTNLHGSLEDIGNIYLTHNETAALECNQGNVLEEAKENDRSDSSVDPWLKEIIAGSQDDVSYYRDVSDVIKNLDNILNSEKTSSSESSHQASPSRDNLSLDCKKDYPVQSSMVKSPGISNFQNLLDMGFPKNDDAENENETDRDTIGTLSHSFERHSDTASQQTLENLTPDTPMKDFDITVELNQIAAQDSVVETVEQNYELPKEVVNNKVAKLKELCVVSKPSLSEHVQEQLIVKDCETSCDSIRTDKEGTKSLVDVVNTEGTPLDEIEVTDSVQEQISPKETQVIRDVQTKTDEIPSKSEEITKVDETETTSENIRTDTDIETETDELKTETDEIRSKSEEQTKVDETQTQSEDVRTEMDEIETVTDEVLTETDDLPTKSEEIVEEDNILPVNVIATNNEEIDTLPSVTEEVSNATEASQLRLDSFDERETTESENNYSKDETILVSDLIDIVTDSFKDQQENKAESKVDVNVVIAQEPKPEIVQKVVDNKEPVDFKNKQKDSIDDNQEPIESKNETVYAIEEDQKLIDSISENQEHVDTKDESVDSINDNHNLTESKDNDVNTVSTIEITTSTVLPPALVQNTNTETLVDSENVNKNVDSKDDTAMHRSDNYVMIELNERSNDSTVYMDLINNTNSQIMNSIVDNKDNKDLETSQTPCDMSTFQNESTVYMDLPSFDIIKKTDDFLHSERNKYRVDKMCASTPITSDNSVDMEALENSTKEKTLVLSTSKPVDDPGATTKEQKCVQESMSPFDSPTKSHHTDTFDENSSVVLGSFENCSLELFKVKPTIEMVEIPREELLAFSSNFSDINLETPSPLRDVNFLNEVPDIMQEDNVFEDLASITEPKEEPPSDSGSGPSGTEKRVSPSTPPNSPGVFPSTEPKYVVEIDLNEATEPNSCSLRDEIELQITSKLAIAENENNMNIEYSGPLTVEGLIEEGGVMRENDEIPESILAGNGESLVDLRENLSLDEECVKALRNELELKLPLAQVASIEPQCEGDGEWSSELPPPPELVVSYPGALSPIQEETGQQLSAYENDMQWNPPTRTDSSESYPEPCNNSTSEATELPTGNQEQTFTMLSRDHSQNHTYTVCKETAASSRDLTMSADSLNASPLKIKETTLSPIDDRTYNKESEKESNCERLSQVSPFLVSPTTDSSIPNTIDDTRASTSKTTLPTDAKHSKPETQCLSKATSIDSWCSNDTLYNVEENFDDLALEYEDEKQDKDASESTDTLTHNEELDHSHCSTYIIHGSKSENCETFSPDSISANDNHTYTKVKTTPSATDVNDSKNTTKDLAYGTLMSGMPSLSNCTTEVVSGFEDAWNLAQPELVRRSPIGFDETLSPPKQPEEKDPNESSPKTTEHSLKKMDSVEISCLQDNLTDTSNKEGQDMIVINDSPNYNYKNMTPSVTSTPLFEYTVGSETSDAIPMQLPIITESNVSSGAYSNFQRSAEVRPQDMSSNGVTDTNTELLLEGESKTQSTSYVSDRTPNYSDFENSAVTKPQDLNSRDNISRIESGISSEEFSQFENSVRNRPQDLSSLIDASSLLLKSERMSSELLMGSTSGTQYPGQSNSVDNITSNDDQSVCLQNVHIHISSIHSSTNSAENESVVLENVHNYLSSIYNITNSGSDQIFQTEDVHNQQINQTPSISNQTTQSEKLHNQNINQSESIGNETTQSDIVHNQPINQFASISHSTQSENIDETTRSDNVLNQQINHSDSIGIQTSQSDNICYQPTQSDNLHNELINPSDNSNQTTHSENLRNDISTIDKISNSVEDQSVPLETVHNQEINHSDKIDNHTTKSENLDNQQINQSNSINNQNTQSDNGHNERIDLPHEIDNLIAHSESDHDQISQPDNVQSNQSEIVNDQISNAEEPNLITRSDVENLMQPIIDFQTDIADQIPKSNVNIHDDINIDSQVNNHMLPIFDFAQSPPMNESQINDLETSLLINFGPDDETEQPHSIIVTEIPMNSSKISPNRTYDSHAESHFNVTYNSHTGQSPNEKTDTLLNGKKDGEESLLIEASADIIDTVPSKPTNSIIEQVPTKNAIEDKSDNTDTVKNNKVPDEITKAIPNSKLNGNGVNIATVNFLSETFEELIESNVDDGDCKDETEDPKISTEIASPIEDKCLEKTELSEVTNGEIDSHKVVTEDFLQNEKKFCQLDSYLPMLSDIRFTGPATEIMSTSFSQDSPTEPTSPECEQDSKPNTAAEILKEWDSDSDSHSSNSSSGEFIWKDGDGHETSVVPTTHFDHQRGSNGAPPSEGGQGAEHGSVSGDSCSGSEGDEVEFVPSSWDCRAEPSKSSLRSLEQASLDASEKKRVVFKRQKYHCVYEYPRETLDAEPNSPAYLPDLSTYSEWDPTSVEEAELCYGHLFSMPNYPLRAGIAIGSDYDEDFFISSSARPFESLGIMSTTSQFFPGMHVKPMLEQLPDDEDFPPPPSPLPTTIVQSRTPSLDFTTPDSGVEDITPGSMDEEFKKKIPESELTWRPVDSASSSESVSPSSPGGEALGGLRHTRDKLKLDLPPSPHVPSPRHNRVFNFVLEKPKRRDERTEVTTPLVMTDETPIVDLPLPKVDEPIPIPEPTFSTFGKCVQKVEPEQKIILAEVETEVKPESPKVVEPVKGEGTVLDSGDEDSGIESSSKATLERKTNVS